MAAMAILILRAHFVPKFALEEAIIHIYHPSPDSHYEIYILLLKSNVELDKESINK